MVKPILFYGTRGVAPKQNENRTWQAAYQQTLLVSGTSFLLLRTQLTHHFFCTQTWFFMLLFWLYFDCLIIELLHCVFYMFFVRYVYFYSVRYVICWCGEINKNWNLNWSAACNQIKILCENWIGTFLSQSHQSHRNQYWMGLYNRS
jgi:hypothetical protein